MNVLVVGGSGVLGLAAVGALVSAGHTVTALARSPAAAGAVARVGARPVAGDLLQPGGLAPVEADTVVHLATAIPRPDRPGGSWAANDRVRTEGTAALLAAARAGGARRVVAASVCGMYGDHGDAWVTEDTPLPDLARLRPELRSAGALERLVEGSGLEWVILRAGWLYGPGTGLTEALLGAAAAGTLRTDGDGSAYLSMVTAADVAQAVVLGAGEASLAGTVLNVVDDRPLRQRDLYAAFASHARGPAPAAGLASPGWGSQRVSNARARALGFRPRHPDVAAGLRALDRRPVAAG